MNTFYEALFEGAMERTGYFIISFVLIFNLAKTEFLFGQNQIQNPDSALVNRLKQIEGTPLSLDQAIRYAMDKSTGIQQAKAELKSAEGAYKRELGFFDPVLFASYQHIDDQSPTASFFSGANILETQQTTSKAGIRMDLPYGTELEASMNANEFKTNSSFASLNPQYDTGITFSVRQSLLSGFAASARKQLSSAEKALEAAQKRYDQTKLDISSEVERNYWDLYAAERDYAVQQLVRDQARAVLDEAQIRHKTGLVGPNEVANAKVFLTQQELALFDSQERLDKMSDQFASLIGQRPEKGMYRFIMTEQPGQDFSIAPVDEVVAQSVEDNYRLQAAKHDIENAKVLAKAAGWEVLPSLDLIGSLGGNGLAGTGRDIVFNGQTFPGPANSQLSDALNQSIKRDYPNWSIGVELTYPIGSRTGSGNKKSARARVVLAEQQFIAAERQLEDQVRNSHRELENGVQRLKIAREQVEAAQEQVRIGLIEFHNGRSTAFELVRLAADFAQAQQRYSQELVRNAKAAATLKQLTAGKYPAENSN
jgi:outer membrane protein TolC